MFTGIIKHTGKFKGYAQGRKVISLEALTLAKDLDLGESLAVNGVCLTLTKKEKSILSFNLSEETLKKSTLGTLLPGQLLNLEFPLTLNDPLGGHLITGHVDAKGKILNAKKTGTGKRFTISFPRNLKPFFVKKGSVALDGISFTTAEIHSSSLEIEVIPLTLSHTNAGHWKIGQEVNLECDILGKYVYNYLNDS